nr:MAG TPA: hypothetical protein [Caudoviricetes sp.]
MFSRLKEQFYNFYETSRTTKCRTFLLWRDAADLEKSCILSRNDL